MKDFGSFLALVFSYVALGLVCAQFFNHSTALVAATVVCALIAAIGYASEIYYEGLHLAISLTGMLCWFFVAMTNLTTLWFRI